MISKEKSIHVQENNKTHKSSSQVHAWRWNIHKQLELLTRMAKFTYVHNVPTTSIPKWFIIFSSKLFKYKSLFDDSLSKSSQAHLGYFIAFWIYSLAKYTNFWCYHSCVLCGLFSQVHILRHLWGMGAITLTWVTTSVTNA